MRAPTPSYAARFAGAALPKNSITFRGSFLPFSPGVNSKVSFLLPISLKAISAACIPGIEATIGLWPRLSCRTRRETMFTKIPWLGTISKAALRSSAFISYEMLTVCALTVFVVTLPLVQFCDRPSVAKFPHLMSPHQIYPRSCAASRSNKRRTTIAFLNIRLLSCFPNEKKSRSKGRWSLTRDRLSVQKQRAQVHCAVPAKSASRVREKLDRSA